jgi:hypothetical protein
MIQVGMPDSVIRQQGLSLTDTLATFGAPADD